MSSIGTEVETETGKRTRALTDKALQLYQQKVKRKTETLNKLWSVLSDLIETIPVLDRSVHMLEAFVKELRDKFGNYKRLTEEFSEFLLTTRTKDSLRARDERHHLLQSQDTIIRSKLEVLTVLIQDAMEIESVRSRRSNAVSTTSSQAARARAKAEAAKVRMEFIHRESELKLKKVTLENEGEMLNARKEIAVAEAEAEALDPDYTNSLKEGSQSNLSLLPKDESKERTTDYVNKLQTGGTMLDPRVDPYVPVAATPGVEYERMAIATELTRLLLKKDLLFSSLTNFNGNPELYRTWKSSFHSKMRELDVTSVEEIDLLVKWTSNEVQKDVLSLKAANADDPGKGLRQIWERLGERYGSPEMVEASLKRRLESFPRLTNKEPKRLYELSDIVSEIEAIKENEGFKSLLAYFDSSSGVTPIVNKLPYNLQEKWTSSATRYMDRYHVVYPPFSHFSAFLREQSKIRNNPSFAYNVTQATVSPRTYHRDAPYISARKTGLVTDTTDKQSGELCPLHNINHSLNKCKQFRVKPIDVRRKFLYEKRLCFRCCSPLHTRQSCEVDIHCDECGSSKHVSALHYDYQKPRSDSSVHGGEQASRKYAINASCAQICGDGFAGKSCAKIVPVQVYHRNRPNDCVKMYALIDDQSNRSLAKAEFFERFGGNYQEEDYSLSSCAGVMQTSGRRAEGFVIQSMKGDSSHDLPMLTECNQIPDLRDEIPTPEVAMNYPHLKSIAENIAEIDSDASIWLLIGRDLTEAHHVHDQKIGPKGTPYAHKLSLGWVIVGESCLGKVHRANTVAACKTHVLRDGRLSLFEPCPNEFIVKEAHAKPSTGFHLKVCKLTKAADVDTLDRNVFVKTSDDDKLGMSIEDQTFLNLMNDQCVKDADGKWVAPLPFRSPRPQLPNNRPQAWKRAQSLHASLQRDSVKKEHMVTFMKGVLENGHAEVAPQVDPDEECWYLPLFGVYHPKKPGKIRGVFDSSAQFEGVSLNQVLLKGPDMLNRLLGVLLRFRKEAIAIAADVEQMFYCFSVSEHHRNYLRFLWYENNDPSKELIEYRMCKHVFGNSPSPAIASYGLRRTALEAEGDFGHDMREFVETNFYVDDGLASVSSAQEAIDLIDRTQRALQTAGIRLHKIISNSKEVIDAFPSEDLAKDLKDLDIGVDALPMQRSLGLCWDLNSDTFTFSVSDNVKPYTRRGVLSTVNSLYDPPGFLAPVTIRGKILLREMVGNTKDWDEPLSEGFREAWDGWVDNLHILVTLKIPRTYHPFSGKDVVSQTLHIYCDASEKAIAAVAYLRTVDTSGNEHVGFVLGKSKVAPKEGHTIPRLELCASVLAVEVGEIVCDELSLAPETVTYYTDSKVVLGYLKNKTRRFYVYVGNRVCRVLKFSKPHQWVYVPTEQNPADHGTRYTAPALLEKSPWLQGPSQLLLGEHVKVMDESLDLVNPEQDKEIRPEVKVCKSQVENVSPRVLSMDRAVRFSCLTNLVKAIACLKHVAASFTLDKGDKCYGWHTCEAYRTPDAYTQAEMFLVKEVQHQYYGREIECLEQGKPVPKSSGVVSLSPVFNSSVLCVGGRLKNADIHVREKHPILIPGKHCLALLIVRRCHESVSHQGRQITEGAVGEAGYWITGGKRLIASVIRGCVTCRKLRGRLGFQKMSELPQDRLQPGPPFSSVGVDCFGPWQIVTRRTRGGQANSKRWAVMFTCLVSRAVHIELVEELSSSSFINALRRFIAVRGKVKLFRSDRGTNFVGATEGLGINVESNHVRNFLLGNGATWIFNPPHSSHMGGVWERMIGVTRRILDSLLLNVTSGGLTHEVLSTFLAEVMAIVNSRPLVPLSSDPGNPYPLSPSMILTHKSDSIVTVVIPSNVKDLFKAQWKRVQILSDMFWKRWRNEFLQTLQERRKWTDDQRDLSVGDVVLVRDKQTARNHWPMGVITQVLPSADGKIRTVKVRVVADSGKPTCYTRPVNETVLLVTDYDV